ncbi:hypothetical protein D030_0157A, partial [Vibrio parahaemolyticus AQ3810]
MCRYVVAD